MSRVIKGAVLQDDNPKVVDIPRIIVSSTMLNDDVISEEDRKFAAACEVFMAEQQKKAEVCLSDAQTQASKILVEAQSKYDEFLNQAKVEAEELKTAAKEEGYRLGYDEGYATALEQVKKEMETAIEEANIKAKRIIEVAECEKKETILKAEREILAIVTAVAEKIIKEKFAENHTLVVEVIKKALEKVKNQRKINIRVSMDDYEFVLQSKLIFESMLDSDFELSIIPDKLIDNGGCIIESENGTVDARLETQLDAIKKAVQDVI